MNSGNIFDDYRQRRKFQRLELKFSNNLNKKFNALEIADILRRMISLYYKASIINSLTTFFSGHGDRSNLLVSRKDLIHEMELIPGEKEHGIFNRDESIEFVYKSGLSVSLAFEEFHYHTDVLFKFFSKINGFLFEWNEKKAIPIRKLKDYLKTLKRAGLAETIKSVRKDALDRIRVESTRKTFTHFSEQQLRLLGIDLNDLNNKTDPEINRPKKDNLDLFFDNIIQQTLPIVAIADQDENEYQILCYRHLFENKDIDNFDVKKIYHESPTTFVIDVTAQYVVALLIAAYLGYKKYLDAEKARLDIEKAKLEMKNTKRAEEDKAILEARIKSIQEALKTASLFSSKYKDEIIQQIQEMEDEDLRGNLTRCWDSIEKEYIDLIEQYELQILDTADV